MALFSQLWGSPKRKEQATAAMKTTMNIILRGLPEAGGVGAVSDMVGRGGVAGSKAAGQATTNRHGK